MGTPELTRNRRWRLGCLPQVEKVMTPRVLLRGGLIIGHLPGGWRRGLWDYEGMAYQKRSLLKLLCSELPRSFLMRMGGSYARAEKPGQ